TGGKAIAIGTGAAPLTISNGTYIGGAAEGGKTAAGGSAIIFPATVAVIISNGNFKGGDASNGTKSSTGGNAVRPTDGQKLTINGGTFAGGVGKSAPGNLYAGAGLSCTKGTATISAGTFDLITLTKKDIASLLAPGSVAQWDTKNSYADYYKTVVVAEGAVSPVITTQPQSASGTYGALAGTLGVTVTEEKDHTYAYQWYLDEGLVDGATAATYSLPAKLSAGTHSYFCKVTATCTRNQKTATTDSNRCTVTVTKQPLTVASFVPDVKPYDGTTAATIASVDFKGLIDGEALTAPADYTVSDAKFETANAVNVRVTGTVVLVENGPIAKNYSLKNGGLTHKSEAIQKIAPIMTITTDAPAEGKMGGKDVEVTVKVTNPAGATAGFPAAHEITIAPVNATLKTALTQTGTTGVYKATYTLGAYTQPDTKAKFTVTIPNIITNYTEYTETDKFVEVTILDKYATTTTLTASKSSITYGEPVTLTATVTPGVSGTVQFKEGETLIGAPVPVANGTATLVRSSAELKALGSPHSFTAVFTSTNFDYKGSTSSPYIVTVAKKPLTVSDGTLAITRDYDGTNTFAAGNATGNLALTGVIDGDTVTVKVDTYGAANDANVGTKTIDLTVFLDGADKENYTITSPYSFTKATITVNAIIPTIEPITPQTYTGSAIEPQITVKGDGKTLTADHYTAVYTNNMNVSNGAKVTVTPKGNYSGGAVEQTFAITKAAAPTPQPGTLSVSNKRAHSYTYNLAQLLTAALNF
ncbi:MAG: YDG domain-containing protein, partial [Oscillospiraceae bacterium]